MLHSPISSLLLVAGVLHASNCLQRSDYVYDRETRMVTMNTNGTTYTCRARDIINPVMDRQMKSSGPCLNGVEVNDPTCIQTEFINIFLKATKATHEEDGPSSCAAPIPSVEETLDRIRKVYRSSLGDHPATKEWVNETLENAARLKTECEANGTRRLYPETLKKAAQLVMVGFLLGSRELLELRGNVSQAEAVLEEAKGEETVIRLTQGTFPSYVEADDFHDSRESLFAAEITALGDSHEFELHTWKELADARIKFVNLVSANNELKNLYYELEHQLTVATRKVAKAEMDVLSKMAQANEMLARIEYIMREVEYNLENACQAISLDSDEIGI